MNARVLYPYFLVFLLTFVAVYGWRLAVYTAPTIVDPVADIGSTDCDFDEIDALTSAAGAVRVGNIYFNNPGNYNRECARYAYERALEIDAAHHPQAWYQLGRIDFLEGEFAAAIFKFQQQYDYFGDIQPGVHYMLGLTYGYRASREGSSGDWKKAEKAFKDYVAIIPNSSWARTDLAWVYFAQGKYEEMKPVLEEGIKSEPRHPWLLNMYGLALLNTNESDMALAYFELAQEELEQLTPETWGRAYPGNHPESWAGGLEEMRESIDGNISAARAAFN